MPLTPEEIEVVKNALESGELPEVLNPLKEVGLFIRTPKQEDEYKNTFKGQVITERDRELYNAQDALIKEEFGVEKKSGEKTSDYLRRAKTESLGTLQTLQEELTELKKTGKSGGTEADKQRIAQLENLLNEEKTARAKDLESYEGGILGSRVEAEANGAISLLRSRLKSAYDDETKGDIVEARIAKFQKEYTPKLENGALVYYTKAADGKAELVTDKTNAKPKTTAVILEELFSAHIEKPKQQTGSGTGPAATGNGKTGENPNPTVENYMPSADVKTRKDLAEDLMKNNILGGSAEFTALMKKHGIDKKLPLQ